MNVLLSYINTQLFIFALKLVRYQPNRTIQGKFEDQRYIFVGADRYIISPTKAQQVGTNNWYSITYGNNKYVAVGRYVW